MSTGGFAYFKFPIDKTDEWEERQDAAMSEATKPEVPEDLKDWYARAVWAAERSLNPTSREQVILIERIAALTAECASLKAEVERLKTTTNNPKGEVSE